MIRSDVITTGHGREGEKSEKWNVITGEDDDGKRKGNQLNVNFLYSGGERDQLILTVHRPNPTDSSNDDFVTV